MSFTSRGIARLLLFVAGYAVFLALGATIFSAIEAPEENRKVQSLRQLRAQFLVDHQCVTDNKMAGYRKPYTVEEEISIIQYIISHEGYTKLRGKIFWQEMEKAKITDRTWQSLKNHFLKQVIPILTPQRYGISLDDVKKITEGYLATQRIPSVIEIE